MNIKSEKEYVDSGVSQLEEINKKSMILFSNSLKIFFRKTEKNEN